MAKTAGMASSWFRFGTNYSEVRSTVYALLAASGLLLALSFASTAQLWIGRAAARHRDAAVRLALGARRTHLARQFVVEALVPTAAGAELAVLDQLSVDARVFGLAVLLSAAASVLFGLVPLGSLRQPLLQGRAARERREGRTLRFLIALQVGLACALLPGAPLLAKSLAALERVDPGFRTGGLVTAYVSLPAGRYPTQALAAAYYQRLEQAFPEISLTSALPLTLGAGGNPFSIEGRPYGASGSVAQFAHAMSVSRDYLATMGIPLLAGRSFEERDFAAASAPVALINQTLAAGFWPGESPLGKRILMGAPRRGARWMTIVGVTGDVRSSALGRPPLPQIYQPFPQSPTRTMALIFAPPGDLRAVARLDPEVPPFDVASMEERVAASTVRPRVRATVFSVYGTLGFLLAGFGVYSVALYASVRRRREFAVRAALGATPAQLGAALLSGSLRPAAAGAAVGLIAAYWLAAGVRAFLYQAAPTDWPAYALTALLADGSAALAAWLGGRRLISTQPADVLRSE